MTRTQSIILGIFFLLIVAVNIFLQSSSWRLPIQNYVNSKLKENTEWQITIPELEGNLLGTVKGKGMKFSHENGSEVIFGDFSIRVNYLRSLITAPTLTQLRVEDILVSPVIDPDSIRIETDYDSLDMDIPSGLNFAIENLLLVNLLEESDEIDLILDLTGDYKYRLFGPQIRSGKIFSPDVHSTVQFIPTSPWQQIPEKEFDDYFSGLRFIKQPG